MPKLADTVAALARYRRPPHLPLQAGAGRLERREAVGTNPGALGMLAYRPTPLGPRAPLVVVLHGCSQDAESYAEGAGWLTLADHHGFAVLCPEQTRANNPNLCFNWFEPGDTVRGGGEAASIAQMVKQAVAEFDCDAGRVFITGLSAGGAMTAAMLATYPELFAAGAVFAGLPYGAASNMGEAFQAMFQGGSRPSEAWGDRVRSASAHQGPWPRVSIWHGDADAVVAPGASDELVKQWANVHGLQAADGQSSHSSGRRQTLWKTAAGTTVLELHRIARMAHGTPLSATGPDGYGTAGPYLLEVGISSSLEVARAWGVADGQVAPSLRAAAARPPASGLGPGLGPEPGPAPRGLPPLPAPLLKGRVDVADVIAQALKSAGLTR